MKRLILAAMLATGLAGAAHADDALKSAIAGEHRADHAHVAAEGALEGRVVEADHMDAAGAHRSARAMKWRGTRGRGTRPPNQLRTSASRPMPCM